MVVLMGAGASHGSGDVRPSNPPLGAKLFAALETAGGMAASLPIDLKGEFRADFEAGMAAFRAHSSDNVMQFQRELARYFTQFEPRQSNVYCDLIRALRGFDVIYASLNYDLLFELAAGLLGHNVWYGSTPPPGFIPLLKPHGSCNFWPRTPRGSSFHTAKIFGNRADIKAPVDAVSLAEARQRCAEGQLSPAIALYAKGKAVKVCPEFVEKQVSQLQQAILSTAAVFVVGVRVLPDDGHIWDALAKTPARVHYFGFDQDRSEFSEWATKAQRPEHSFQKADFSRAVPLIEQLLQQLHVSQRSP